MARLLALVDDLMFLSRIREAAQGQGVTVQAVRGPSQLLEASRAAVPALVLADLDSPRLGALEAVRALRAEPGCATVPVIGFFSHVQAERSREALAAGFTRALARSAFVQALPELVARAATSS